MRRILMAMVLSVSLAGFAQAQGEMTGDEADKVKVEIINDELQKLTYLVQNGEVAANYRNSHDSDVIVGITAKGIDRHSRESATAKMLAGELFMLSQYQYGQKVYVYDNGKAAVCTYYTDAVFKIRGKTVPEGLYAGGSDKTLKGNNVRTQSYNVDVYAKWSDGTWKRIAHYGHPAANPAAFPSLGKRPLPPYMMPIIGVENHPSS